MSQILVNDNFSFANFVFENDLIRFENRDYDRNLDLHIEEELVEGSPYDHTGMKCTNRNAGIPIPKRDEISDFLVRISGKSIAARRFELHDTIACYKPFHFHNKWGLYFFMDKIVRLVAGKRAAIMSSNSSINSQQVYDMLFRKTFFHEMYHHKIEMFATKMEFVLRTPVFSDKFYKFYCGTFGLDYCLEEAFANVYGTLKCALWMKEHHGIPEKETIKLLREHVLYNAPKGYRVAYEILGNTKPNIEIMERNFLEMVSSFVFEEIHGSAPERIDAELYDLFTYRLDPKVNAKNQVTFMI
jgi:hypothetical protein